VEEGPGNCPRGFLSERRMISNCYLAIRISLQVNCCAHEPHETCGRIMVRILVGCAKGVYS
jgi:hypothetical protein